MKKYVNGLLTDMTAEEISARETEVAIAKAEHTQRNIDIQNKETKKASGKQKLLDLGLTTEEVKALIGV
tara:strand:- start:53 stop:259 length:207 start_codon:yes stop_codon:yes gene_type:complete